MEEQIEFEAMNNQPQNSLPPKVTRETLHKSNNPKKDAFFSWAKSVLYVFLSAILVSFTAYVLIEPNQFTIGGVSGIAILVNVSTNGVIPQSLILICLNAPLVITSFFFVKKKFAILSLLNILLQYLSMMFFEEVFPSFTITFAENGEKIFAAIAAGLCIYTGLLAALGDTVLIMPAVLVATVPIYVIFALVFRAFYKEDLQSLPFGERLLPILEKKHLLREVENDDKRGKAASDLAKTGI